jgi:hypothetical protein
MMDVILNPGLTDHNFAKAMGRIMKPQCNLKFIWKLLFGGKTLNPNLTHVLLEMREEVKAAPRT